MFAGKIRKQHLRLCAFYSGLCPREYVGY